LRFRQGEGERTLGFNTAWLIAVPLILGLRTSVHHARAWTQTFDAVAIQAAAARWRTSELEWFRPPWGEHFWVEAAMEQRVKLSEVWFPWYWDGRLPPLPRTEGTRGVVPEGAAYQRSMEGVDIYLHESRDYASIHANGESTACTATGGAGDITVRCPSAPAGELVVEENSWTGWRVWVDGERADLLGGDRLRVRAPEGEHEFRFRYIPLDVPLGLVLTLAGIVLSILLWIRAEPSRAENSRRPRA
jgi:hypothetical protein